MISCLNLLPIQKLDLEIDEANAQILEKQQKFEKNVATVNADLKLNSQKLALLKKITLRKRAAETEFEALNEKLEQTEKKTMTAGLAPASYDALQKEIKVLKASISEIESAILTDMEKIEQLEEATSKAAKVLEGRQKHLEEIKVRVADEKKEILKKIEILKTERSQATLKIPADQLGLYEELRNSKKGQVIFDIESTGCPACGMGLPGGFITKIKSHFEAEECPYCHILLRWTGLRE